MENTEIDKNIINVNHLRYKYDVHSAQHTVCLTYAKMCAPIKMVEMRKQKIELRLSFNWNT